MRLRESLTLSLFSQGIVFASGLLNGIIIARTLGTVGRGEYAMVYFMVTMFLVIFGEGIYRSNIYITSRDKSDKNINRLSSNLFLYNIFLAGIFIFILLLPNSLYDFFMPDIKPIYIYLGLGTALFFIFIRQFQGIFLGLQNYWYYNLFNTLPIFLFLLLDVASLLVWGALSTTSVLINFFGAMVVTFLISLLMFTRKFKIQFQFSYNILKSNFSSSWRATVSYLLIFLLIRLNVYIVNHWQGLAETGLFAVAMGIAYMLQQIPNVVGVVLFPKVADQVTEKKLSLTSKVAGVTFLVTLVPTTVLYVFGKDLIIFFYKEEFIGSYLPLAWLLPGIVLFSITGVFNPLIWGKGFPPISMIGPLVPLIINIVLCYFLIPINGIIGAAQAATISFMVYSLIMFGYVLIKREELNS